MAEFLLSNGEVVNFDGLTIGQAKKCNFHKLLNKVMGMAAEDGNQKTINISFTEDEIISVLKVVYPKYESLKWSEALELFGFIIEETLKKS